MGAANLLQFAIQLYNTQKQGRFLAVDDYILYDETVMRVKDVVFTENRGIEIDAEIYSHSPIPVQIMIPAQRDTIFTVVLPRMANPNLRG
jgi:hypothetical protein